MKYKVFDVVELNNGNKATILDIDKNMYKAEIVNNKGVRQEVKEISDLDIKKQLFSK